MDEVKSLKFLHFLHEEPLDKTVLWKFYLLGSIVVDVYVVDYLMTTFGIPITISVNMLEVTEEEIQTNEQKVYEIP